MQTETPDRAADNGSDYFSGENLQQKLLGFAKKLTMVWLDHTARFDDGLEQLKRLTELVARVLRATNSPTWPLLGAIVK